MKSDKLPRPSAQRIPERFLARMQDLLGSEYPAYLGSLSQPAVNGLRVNELKIHPSSFLKISPYPLKQVPWCPSGYILEMVSGEAFVDPPGKHPHHAAGLYYLQDPSAMAVAEILDPRPGETILDLAAAPGGKSTHIASLMKNRGVLVANEIHPQRVRELSGNLERWGTRGGVVVQETPSNVAERLPGSFDRVLLDAPCSGEGMFRKSAAARMEWSIELVKSCALRQSSILQDAARLVRPGGVLVYSTCTFAPEENEGVVAGFLASHPEFELEEIRQVPGFSAAISQWALDEGAGGEDIYRAVRLWPHHVDGEGHFIARMRCSADHHQEPHKRPTPVRVASPHVRAYEDFCSMVGIRGAFGGDLHQVGERLYLIPENIPNLSGLRLIHPGLWLGTIKRGEHTRSVRFEPAHALAMALSTDGIDRFTPLNTEQAESYLHGEVLDIPGIDGWTLMTLDGFPMGWGKRVRGLIKNVYPKGLRWL